MKYFSIDIETSGLDAETCQILEFAAVYEDTSQDIPLEELPTFHSYVLPYDGKTIRGEPYALRMNAAIIAKIAEYMSVNKGVPPSDLGDRHEDDMFIQKQHLADAFRRWTETLIGDEKANFAGKNLGNFDLGFLKRLDNWGEVKYRHRLIDPAMGFWNPIEDEMMPNLDDCLKRAGIRKVVTHKALDDSFDVIQTIRYIKKART